MGKETPQSVIDIARHYEIATGIPCTILSMSKPSVGSLSCSLCSHISQKESISPARCLEMHHHNALQSERFGGSYVYFCPCSLLYWSSPVIFEGIMTHALVAGPVMVLDHDEILSDMVASSEENVEVQELFAQVKTIEISQAHSLSELLRMCAGWGSGYREHKMVEVHEELNVQSKLSEYLQKIKQTSEGEDKRQGSYYYPLSKENELQRAIIVGDRQSAQELLNELLGIIFFASGNTLERIRFRVMELVILLSRAAVKGQAPEKEVMEISYRCQRELSLQRNMESIARWLSSLLHEYISLVFNHKDIKHVHVIAQAIHYIRNHYTTKITLLDAASHVGLSPTYFSKIFNEELGCQFSVYINQLRIEEAKNLLLHTRYTLVEIAGLVGFDDQGYFSRVFKQITGKSPGSFRSRAGIFPSDKQEIHSP